MFVQRFSFGDWGWSNGNIYTNRLALFTGLRDNSLVPFGQGWGWCTVNPNLFTGWDDNDPRKLGSILQVGQADQGTGDYVGDKGDHEGVLCHRLLPGPQEVVTGTGDLLQDLRFEQQFCDMLHGCFPSG